jgi:hypothetical protein
MVTKRGRNTGLTVGRSNDIVSYAQTSNELAILPFNSGSGTFSKMGDSGSVTVDRFGRIGGLLHWRCWHHDFLGRHLCHTYQLSPQVHA